MAGVPVFVYFIGGQAPCLEKSAQEMASDDAVQVDYRIERPFFHQLPVESDKSGYSPVPPVEIDREKIHPIDAFEQRGKTMMRSERDPYAGILFEKFPHDGYSHRYVPECRKAHGQDTFHRQLPFGVKFRVEGRIVVHFHLPVGFHVLGARGDLFQQPVYRAGEVFSLFQQDVQFLPAGLPVLS